MKHPLSVRCVVGNVNALFTYMEYDANDRITFSQDKFGYWEKMFYEGESRRPYDVLHKWMLGYTNLAFAKI